MNFFMVRRRERGIVALADDTPEGAVGLLCGVICQLDRKAVEGVEVVAGDDRAAVQIAEVLDALDIFDDQLFVRDQIVDVAACRGKGYLALHLLGDAALAVFDLVGHEGT